MLLTSRQNYLNCVRLDFDSIDIGLSILIRNLLHIITLEIGFSNAPEKLENSIYILNLAEKDQSIINE